MNFVSKEMSRGEQKTMSAILRTTIFKRLKDGRYYYKTSNTEAIEVETKDEGASWQLIDELKKTTVDPDEMVEVVLEP